MESGLKIVLVSNLYPPHIIGGAELIVSNLARGLTQLGHEVSVVTTHGPKEKEPLLYRREEGVRVISFFPKNLFWWYEKKRAPSWRKLLWHLKDAWNKDVSPIFQRLFTELSPHIVHTHNIVSFSPVVWQAARRLGLPVVHTAHDCFFLCPRFSLLKKDGRVCDGPTLPCRLFRQWYAAKLALVDVFCAPSEFVVNLHRSGGGEAGAFCAVPNGIDISPGRIMSRPCIEKLRLLYLGRLAYGKGVQTLLEAFTLLPRELPVTLEVAGRGEMEGPVREAARADRRISYRGFVFGEEKNLLLADNDILLLPAIWYESSPVSIMEAYSHGLAVIGSDRGGITELVRPGKTGFLFPAADAGALAALIEKTAASPDMVNRLKEKAAKIALDYSLEKMTERYLAVYRGLVSRRF